MSKPPAHPARTRGDVALIALCGTIALAVAGITAALFLHKPAQHVLALASAGDCLRHFDDTACRALVAAALDLHGKSAPRFPRMIDCEMGFGSGKCRKLETEDENPFVPEIAVILAAKGPQPEGLLPLYFGPPADPKSAEGARRVYYRGAPAGYCADVKFGGADLARVTGLRGTPWTIGQVMDLRAKD